MSTVYATIAAWALEWWELWVVVLAGVLGSGLTPAVVGRTESTRPLDPELAEAVRRVGVPAERVRVITDDRGPVAFSAGLISTRGRVFVSQRLVEDLAPDETAAVVCHEYGHLVRRHVPVRVGVPVAFALVWAVGASFSPGPGFLVGVALVAPAAYLTVRVSRWTEYDADRFAGERGVGGPLAAALVSLVETGHVTDGGPFSRHPPLATRVARLDGGPTSAEPSSAESTDIEPAPPSDDSGDHRTVSMPVERRS